MKKREVKLCHFDLKPNEDSEIVFIIKMKPNDQDLENLNNKPAKKPRKSKTKNT
jgi:hypothetical protein